MFGSEKVSFRRYTITRSLKTMSSVKDEHFIRNPDGVGRSCLTSYSSAAMWCSGTVKSRVGGTVGNLLDQRGRGRGQGAWPAAGGATVFPHVR